jgi:hypothetical protein
MYIESNLQTLKQHSSQPGRGQVGFAHLKTSNNAHLTNAGEQDGIIRRIHESMELHLEHGE